MTWEKARVLPEANGWVDPGPGTLERASSSDVRVLRHLSDGLVATVYRAELRGLPVALKIFRASSVLRHAGRNRLDIAEFEYRRNRAFYEAPGLARYVARPLGYFHAPGVSAVVQELLRGELYYDHYRNVRSEDPAATESLFAHVRRIVELSHAAGLFDLDLHALNVMVVRERSEAIPKLFDFNRIPFYEHPRNPLEALLLRLGLLDVRSRDMRKLQQFNDFRRLEKRLRRARALPAARRASPTGL